MRPILVFIKKLRPEEILALVMTAVGLGVLAVIEPEKHITGVQTLKALVRYFSFGDAFFALFFVFIWIAVFVHIFLRSSHLAVQYFVYKKNITRTDVRYALVTITAPMRLLLPIALVTIPTYAILESISIQLRFQTVDIALNAADKIVFGFSPFIYLPTVFSFPFFDILIEYSYTWLGYALSLVGIILFILKRTVAMRRMIFAFLLSIVLAYPLFYLVPCQDPNNFFLRNLRNHQLPADVLSERTAYSPSVRVTEMIRIIEQSETDTQNDNAVPISCFPSSHALWAIFAVYFLATITAWSLIVSLPWLILLLLGGIYFAQHYVIDYLVAIPIAIICIVLAHYSIHDDTKTK
jgi:hypothetical protein